MIKKITLSSVILAFIVVLLGAYIQLSGAQLACPDWPGCFGQVVVSDDADFKSLAAKAFPDFPVDTGNACLVMAHRYLTAFLALMLLALNLLSWKRQPQQKSVFIASTFLLALVFVQAFLNAWLVRLDAMPVIVTAHVFIGLVIFWQLYRLYLHIDPGLSRTTSTRGPLWFSRFAMLILLVQIVLGVWVSTNQAAQVCKTFLGCNEQGFSGTIYQNTFSYLREILSGYTGVISTDAQIAVLSLHRLGGLVSFIVLAIVLIFGFTKNNPKSVKNASLGLAALSLIQLCLVLIGMKLNMPPWITLPHLACSILLMLPLIGISFYSRYAYAEKQQPTIEFEKRPEPTPSVTVPVSVPLEKEEYIEPSPASLLSRLKSQLKRTRSGLGDLFASLPFGEKAINEDLLEEIEAGLIMADVGIDTTHDIINRLTHQLERHQLNDGEALSTALKQELLSILLPCSQPLQIPEQDKPFVILVVGVNGAGKTTTIGKLAKRLQAQGKSVMLAAGDTFRAAAVEQLQVWGARNNIHVVAQHTGADSASVIYDGVQSALAKGVDVLIADTAGRLQTKSNLMDELKKVKRIMAKLDETAPHEVLLVLDAGTGQNALSQAKLFNETVALTGLVLTKLDGTAKGGVIFALAKQTGIPIRFIGIGEGIDDLQDFDAKTFVDALFVKD